MKRWLGIIFMIFALSLGRTVAHAVDCPAASAGADLTLSSSCLFPGVVDGVDNGAPPKNTANLTISKGTTLTIVPDQTIVAGSITVDGGTIIIFDGAQIYPGGSFWMKDGDQDGYPSSTDVYASIEGGSQPSADAVRKNTVYAAGLSDRDDTIPCPDAAYNTVFTPPVCNVCYHGAPDPVVKNTTDARCTSGSVCDGTGACYSLQKRIFISSVSYTGSLGGLAGADNICQTLANTAGIGGTWKAWLSSSLVNAADRLTHNGTSYVLLNGTTVANNWTGIVSGSLLSSINIDEKQQSVSPGTGVWTNTNSTGTKIDTAADRTCADWTNQASYRGRYGLNERTGSSGWTDTNYARCSTLQRLYCFEQ